MKATAEAGKLKNVAAAIAAYAEEGNIRIRSDGLHGAAADPAFVGLVDFHVKDSYFQSYDARLDADQDKLVAGANFETVKKLLGKFGSSVEVTLTIDTETIKVETANGSAELRSLDLDTDEEPDPDQLEFTDAVDATTQRLGSVLSQCDLFAGSTTITASDGTVTFYSEGDMGETTQELGVDTFDGSAEASMSLDYLKDAVKALDKVTDGLTMHLETDVPMKLETEDDGLRLAYIIAPRIEE